MKNRNKFIILVLALIGLNTSCTKWLEEENFTSISSDYIYWSAQGLEVGLGGLYNLLRSHERVYDVATGSLWYYCADDLGQVRTFNDGQIYEANMTALNMPSDKWTGGYQLIDRASAIISSAPNITMPVATQERIIEEAKVIKAMVYFRLIQTYNNILIDTIATTTENAFDKVVYTPASKDDVYKLINSDLDYAIAKLSYTVKPGQVGKALAKHLRAQTASWASDWTTMAAQCEGIIASSGLTLVPIDKVFAQDVNHKETIFAYQYDEILGTSSSLAGGNYHNLSALFSARYYEIPGGYMIEDNNWGGNSFAWKRPNDYLQSLYDKANDKRYVNYFYPEIVIGNKPGTAFYGKPLPASSYSDNYRQYHFSSMKYRDFSKPDGRAAGYKDVIAYRLAETLIMAAEARWRMTQNPTDARALEYIGKVRTRASMPNFTSIDQKTLLEEYARELNFEGGRWFLLKRMGVLVEQVNKYHTYGSAKTNQVIAPMQTYHVRWPIPQGQINLMGGTFPQNQGY